MSRQILSEQLLEKLKVLSEVVWETNNRLPEITRWMNQFETSESDPSSDEQLHALYLLSNFIYFGQSEIRTLLVSLFRDLYKTPIVHSIRRSNANTTNSQFLEGAFIDELSKTRFLGVGNPSESGVHLLYYFRQENSLPKTLFINSHEIFSRDITGGSEAVEVRNQEIKHYVFIDDLCGSGTQAELYSRDLVDPLRALKTDVKIHYLVLFATTKGLEAIRALNRYDTVEAVYELDETFQTFNESSRIFSDNNPNFDRVKIRATTQKYGALLWPSYPLGYKDGQLLIGFGHNTPDNTLPIFWAEKHGVNSWEPIFKRYHKNYGN